MELSRGLYEACRGEFFAAIPEEFHDYVAAGLAGEGSECFGYDDFLSEDHDFGPDFCIWIPAKLYRERDSLFEAAYAALPDQYRGYAKSASRQVMNRRGVMTIEGFYQKYTGITHPPADVMEWFRIPQSFLATAVNGAVFEDRLGEFTRWRETLKTYYPEDVIRKKLAAKAVLMGQAGQYNYVRSCRREDWGAAYLSGCEFVKAAFAAIYLLNRKYMPFYKWVFRGSDELTELRNAVTDLKAFVRMEDRAENAIRKRTLIEAVSNEVIKALVRKGYSRCRSDFLEAHASSIMEGIREERLRRLHVLADYDQGSLG